MRRKARRSLLPDSARVGDVQLALRTRSGSACRVLVFFGTQARHRTVFR